MPPTGLEPDGAVHENWVAGKRRSGDRTLDVHSPFDGAVVGVATLAEPGDVESALASAHAA